MIRSMTAFGNAKADLEQGTLALELRASTAASSTCISARPTSCAMWKRCANC